MDPQQITNLAQDITYFSNDAYVPQGCWTSRLTTSSSPTLRETKADIKEKTAPRSSKKKDDSRIPRPANSFILFRTNFVNNRPSCRGAQNLSKEAGAAWRLLSSSEKKKWEKKAHDVALDHIKRNPGYAYKPARKSGKKLREPASELSQSPVAASEAQSSSEPSLQDWSLPPNLMRRRESLRLFNWDDTVLSVDSHEGSVDQPIQLPEPLRRRSSSVPVPETLRSNAGMVSVGQIEPLPVSPLGMHRRISYSGIRPGFTPMEIHGLHQQQDHFKSSPIQPLRSFYDALPPSFENYSLRVACNPFPVPSDRTPSEDCHISPRPEPDRQNTSPLLDQWSITCISSPVNASRSIQKPKVRSDREEPTSPNNRFGDFSPPALKSNFNAEKLANGGFNGINPQQRTDMYSPHFMSLGNGPSAPVSEGLQFPSPGGRGDGETTLGAGNGGTEHHFSIGESVLPELDVFTEFLQLPRRG